MNVLLTFDIELWCTSWNTLDADFPGALERYVYGRSRHGDYALPKTLEILVKHGLHGVFFVEPLFAARFGVEHLATVVELIREAGQEVQLHLHPEWTDEITPALIPNNHRKRQHLAYYDVEEQAALVGHGLRLLTQAGVPDACAFRAGSFAANASTFQALRRNGLRFDSSLNPAVALSLADVPGRDLHSSARMIDGICEYPISVFRDGLGKLRHAQVGACGAAELRQALEAAFRDEASDFVILSHNFEMLKPASTSPDWFVVRRFESLCSLLGRTPEWPTIGFAGARESMTQAPGAGCVSVGLAPTGVRLVEQGLRRALAGL